MSTRSGSRALVAALFAAVSCLLAVSGAMAAGPLPDATGVPGASSEPAPGSAVDPTVTWGVHPADNAQGTDRPNYTYELAPGAQVEDGFVVTNHGEKPLTLDVYVADAVITQNGQLNLANRDVTPVGVGSWVDVASHTVTVPAGEEVEVPFTLTVPSDVTPGDHSGGIVSSLTGVDPATITVERRLGSRIHVRVDGELRPALQIDRLEASSFGSTDLLPRGGTAVSFTVTNSGNTRMTGNMELRLRGPLGLAARVVPLDRLPELLPGSSHDVSVTVPDVPATVRMTATVAVTPLALGPDDATGAAIAPIEASTTIWAIPWIPVGIVVLVLAWLAPRALRRVRAWWGSRRVRRAGGGVTVAEGTQATAAAAGSEAMAAADGDLSDAGRPGPS